MKNFAYEDSVNDTGVEIIDLDPPRKRSNWFLIGQRFSSRARLWKALFTLLSVIVLGVIVFPRFWYIHLVSLEKHRKYPCQSHQEVIYRSYQKMNQE